MGAALTQRFFRATTAVYESVRLQLDAAWGHGPGTGTITCIEPAATAPRDFAGRCLLAVKTEFCHYELVAALLPQLLSGGVEEISESQYRSQVPELVP